MRRREGAWILPLLALAALALPARAQDVDSRTEGRMLQEASAREARGDLTGAEGVLRTLLDRAPSSASGLFALERVLRAQHRVAEILPLADRSLAEHPDADAARYLKLRVLAEVDSLDALEAAGDAWLQASPGDPAAYRQVARVYGDAFGAERALDVLRKGMDAVDQPGTLAPDAGDLLVAMGRRDEAVAVWARGLTADGGGVEPILQRLGRLGGDPASLADDLVDALVHEPTTAGRRRAAVQVATRMGLHARALKLAQGLAGELQGDDRTTFLSEVARWGESARADSLRLWAYRALRPAARRDSEARGLDASIAEAALAVGDTAGSLQARVRLAGELPAGSAERRRVAADVIALGAGRSEPDTLLARFQAFHQEFPDAPEGDALASRVATVLQARGRGEDAVRVLTGVAGPRSALERAYLLLADGDVEGGRKALLQSLDGLPPTQATDVIQLVALLGRLQPRGAAAVAAAAVAAHRGRGGDAADALAAAAGALSPADQAAVLAQAARLADEAGDAAGAARLRTALVEEHGDAPEAAEATVALARWRAARGDSASLQAAAKLLQDLIVSHPGSAVVPEARRELERIKGRIP